jgi:AraC-like DNA-binding protein/quercetin dioxygenase-like cupin family protein
MRQPTLLREFDPKRGVAIATLAYDYPSGYLVSEHAHGSDQLIYATRGLMEVRSGQSMWLIPPSFAIWVPVRTVHRIRMTSAVSMRTLYIRPGLVGEAAPSCAVLGVTPLLRELVLEAVHIGQLRLRSPEHCALRDLIVLHISRSNSIPTHVRLPRDPRALSIALQVIDHPANFQPVRRLCAQAGVGVRTLQRIFVNDLGVDLNSWRRQFRLTKAIELLVAGGSVKQVAFAVGYRQPSAFVSAFRRTFGASPKAWVDQLQSG